MVDFSADLGNRYTFWSGLTGGCFLAMSYFGTDQSQVQRYLSGRSIAESRLGLLFNGLFKVPMQFLILFVGVMVFVFYQFNPPPLFFNESEVARVYQPAGRRCAGSGRAPARARRETSRSNGCRARSPPAALPRSPRPRPRFAPRWRRSADVKRRARALISATPRPSPTTRTTRVSLVRHGELSQRLIGLLLAVILCAAMSSTASELTALGGSPSSTSIAELAQGRHRYSPPRRQLFTGARGVLAVAFAARPRCSTT